MEEGEAAPKRSSMATLLLVVLAVGGSAAGVMIYQFLQGNKNPTIADTTGFDIAVADNTGRSPSPSAQPSKDPKGSGLGMVTPGMKFGTEPGQAAPPAASQAAAGSFTEAVRACEASVRAYAIAYTKNHPSIAAYGRDWMASPELKKLNDDYMDNHDPVAFMRGVASSKDFGGLIKKYAGDPAVQGFVKGGISQAPPDVMSAGMSLLKEDSAIKGLVSNVGSSLGLPPGMMAGFMGGGKVDEKQVLGSIMGGADMQKTLSNPALKNNDEIQKALQKAQGSR